MILALIACVGGPSNDPTVARELGRGTAGGLAWTLSAEDHGWTTPGHLGPEGRYMDERHHTATYVRLEVARAGADVPIHGRVPPAPGSAASSTLLTCPAPDGSAVGLVLGSQATVLVDLGGKALLLPAPGASGADLGPALADLPAFVASAPASQTACAALLDAGRTDLLVPCFAAGGEHDIGVWSNPPAEGPREAVGRALERADRDRVAAAIAADPALLDALGAIVLALPEPGTPGRTAALVEPLANAGRRDALVATIARRCADPADVCPRGALDALQTLLRWRGQIDADACRQAAEIATAVAHRPEPDAASASLTIMQGFGECDEPALRPLFLEALAWRTSDDIVLSRPDARSYDAVDADCRPYPVGGRLVVGWQCRSWPRFAGTWLGSRCGPDAVDAAKRVVAARDPSRPVDPREDQVLDGALRVLAPCDRPGFEAVIAPLPETVVAAADVRSRQNIRKAYGLPGQN